MTKEPVFGMRSLGVLAGVLLVAVGAIASACGGGDNDGGDGDASAGVQEINISMTDEIRFEPSRLEVEAGRPVRMIIGNPGDGSDHDFTIESIAVENVSSQGGVTSGGHGMDAEGEYDLHLALDPGGEGILEFTPTEAGEYAYYCTVVGHADAGMAGTLVVS